MMMRSIITALLLLVASAAVPAQADPAFSPAAGAAPAEQCLQLAALPSDGTTDPGVALPRLDIRNSYACSASCRQRCQSAYQRCLASGGSRSRCGRALTRCMPRCGC